MSKLKIGDRVKVVLANGSIKTTRGKILNGATGTVKDTSGFCFTGVEFDDDIGGNTGSWNGKKGHCGYVDNDYLEKIEETGEETKEEAKEEVKEETKVDTLEQKILTALREEIGVDIGEEFDVYENGEKQWTCKFEEIGFFHELDDEFHRSGVWKDIVYNFCRYTFKRKPFVPKYSQEYFYLYKDNLMNEELPVNVELGRWVNGVFDHGMLAIGNVFKTEEEALKGKDKVLERLEKLRNGE